MRRGVALAVLVPALAAPASAWARDVQVVVRLDAPGAAEARAASPVLSAAAKRRQLDVAAPETRSFVANAERAQAAFEARLRDALPAARVHRRYTIVLNGLSVLLPQDDLERLSGLPGVREVLPSVTYRRRLDRSVPMIGAPSLWTLEHVEAGAGMKIAIIDDGVDHTHPFFSPAGYAMPPGFPKGQTALTSAKVIVARAFAPATATWPAARRAFDPELSFHGTHVAGIAAGNAGTAATAGTRVAGTAPRAYLGNYKVLTVPTPHFGLNGNAPEIAAGIEAAVEDGMDVINLSLGQPEIEPTRDLVAIAIRGASAAGVPTVAAGGNDFSGFGFGSVGSPGSAAGAITAGSVTKGAAISPFSSGGPSAISLRLKPDVAAPGSSIVSAVPGARWEAFSGTSMAAPHVAGGVALLRKRHPTWTPEQVRSALVTTATPAGSPLRSGGGIVNLVRADAPLLFAIPSTISLGLVRPGALLRTQIALGDAGGGAGTWQVSGRPDLPATVTVPGELSLSLEAGRGEGDVTGHIVLTRGTDVRRIPYWYRVAVPRLARPTSRLVRTGTYRGSTTGRANRVTRYRYPERPSTPPLRGPEQVFRVLLTQPVENFGVAVVSGGVQPRVVRAGDENRLTGYAGLPINLNPYLERVGSPQPVAGAIRPAAGAYDVVFDSPARGSQYRFRFWIDDTRPPAARLVSAVARGGVVRIRVTDAGSGVDPRSLVATVDGDSRRVRLAGDVAQVDVRGLGRGTHTVRLRVSDYQESKNMENALRILPNTRFFSATFRVP